MKFAFVALIAFFTPILPAEASPVSISQGNLHFASATEAVQYVQDENNIINYKGLVFGSEEYIVVLPSGKEVSNWFVDCAFSNAFSEFGKESIPLLIELLDSNAAYLRIGAHCVLQKKAGRYDDRSLSPALDQRKAAFAEWKAWWERNKNNPRLNSPMTHVYSAEDWERH